MMLLVRMLLRMCYLAIPLSFAAFVSHLWNIIFIPLTYLLYRIQDGIVHPDASDKLIWVDML